MVISSGPSTRMSCSRGPGPGSGGTATWLARLGAQRAEQRLGQVPGDVAGLLVALQADEDPPVRLGHRRGGHRQHRGQGDRPVAVLLDQLGRQPQRRGRGRHQLAQRDPLRLVGQPLERAGHEDVAHLLALRGAVRRRPRFFRRLLTAQQPRRPTGPAWARTRPTRSAAIRRGPTGSRGQRGPARRRGANSPGPDALPQPVPLDAPAVGQRRRRCAARARRRRPVPAVRISGGAARAAVGDPDLDLPGALGQAAAARPPGPRRREAASACRTALPTSSASDRHQVGEQRRRDDSPVSSPASRCRASRAPAAWCGTTTHHARSTVSATSCLLLAAPRRGTAAGSAARQPHLCDRTAAGPRTEAIPIHSAVRRSGGRDRDPSPAPG